MRVFYLLYRSKRVLLCALACVLLVGAQGVLIAVARSNDSADWANPSGTALQRVSDVNPAQHEPLLLNNVDCSLLTYHTPSDDTMRSGCFTPTAFGLLDNDSDMLIPTGTDEAVPFVTPSGTGTLVSWPEALPLLSYVSRPTGGGYLKLYKNPLTSSENRRNLLGKITSRELQGSPDLTLTDSQGQPIVVRLQTLAFSDGGSWLVAETLTGSFIRINLTTLETLRFGPTYGNGAGSSEPLDAEVAVSHDGRFVAVHNKDASVLKVYDLQGCEGVEGDGYYQTGHFCPAHDYNEFVSGQVGGIRLLRHVRFAASDLLSFEVTAGSATKDGVYVLAPTASIDSLTGYIGLGDSFSSGEGAFDYSDGTDTANSTCHLSRLSYPLLLTRDLFSATGGHSVACSGAVINNIGSSQGSYRGQIAGAPSLQALETGQTGLLSSIFANFVPGYLPQRQFVQHYRPRVVTVGIGGNDIGFGAMIQNCAVPQLSRHLSDSTCYNTYEDRLEVTKLIDRTVARWTTLYKQLSADKPGVHIYAIGYPQVINDEGNCGLNVQLNQSELEFSVETTAYLNHSIAKAAAAAHVQYVDISQALVGHRLCEGHGGGMAVNGLTAGNDAGPFGAEIIGRESYHPNRLGQQLMEQAILSKTHNLTDWAPASTVSATSSKILDKPKSGRQITTKIPVSGVTTPNVKKGSSTTVKVPGGSGTVPGKIYTVHLDGPTGPVIGTVPAGGDGGLDGPVTIPGDTSPGGHTIDVTGPSEGDTPIDTTQPVYVPADDSDRDGDGQPDASDSCPNIPNSGVDTDHDGIDDVCDGQIDDSPSPPNLPPPTTPTTPAETPDTPQSPSDPGAPPSNTGVPLSGGGITIAGTLTTEHQGSQSVVTKSSSGTWAAIGAASQHHGQANSTNTVDMRLAAARSSKQHSGREAIQPGLGRVPWLYWSVLLAVGLLAIFGGGHSLCRCYKHNWHHMPLMRS